MAILTNERRVEMENTEMTYEQRHAKEYEKVSLREQICYGLGDSACNVVYGLCSTLLTFSILIMWG